MANEQGRGQAALTAEERTTMLITINERIERLVGIDGRLGRIAVMLTAMVKAIERSNAEAHQKRVARAARHA